MLMKRIFFVLFAFIILVSCSSDDGLTYHYELLPIENVIIPEEFEYGKIYDISVKYILPDDCYVYSDILYEYDNDERNVAVISTVIDNKVCNTVDFEDEIFFKVHVLQTNTYIFKFWQGDDDNGDPLYLIKEVPVVIIN